MVAPKNPKVCHFQRGTANRCSVAVFSCRRLKSTNIKPIHAKLGFRVQIRIRTQIKPNSLWAQPNFKREHPDCLTSRCHTYLAADPNFRRLNDCRSILAGGNQTFSLSVSVQFRRPDPETPNASEGGGGRLRSAVVRRLSQFLFWFQERAPTLTQAGEWGSWCSWKKKKKRSVKT